MRMTIAGRGITWRSLALAAVALAGLGLLATAGTMRAASPARPAYLQAFPNFATKLTPQLPGDVDVALKTRLEKAQKFSEVQREFDLYSWQMFLSLNWPTDDRGRAARKIADTAFGAPYWTLWHASSSIFQTDGARPEACGLPAQARNLVLRRDLSKPVSRGLKPFSAEAVAGADHRRKRFLGVISAVGELNAANLGDDIQQAFSGPLLDQNGEFVFYEIIIDPNEVNYLCDNGLYNINGQVAFSQAGNKVVMPIGVPNQDRSGAFELKLAWRILKQGKDDFSRYYSTPATVIDQGPDGQQLERQVTVGLVGMHIGHKSSTSPQWIWSTFEQVDNLDVDDVSHPNLGPSFFDPNCWICAVNQEPAADNSGVYPRTPTQVWRAIAIPEDKQRLNAQAQAALRRIGSVWQYYQLIDTQWPTDPGAPPGAWDGGLADAVANKPGGRPTPVFLTNVTMETYFQGQNLFPGVQTYPVNQAACGAAEVPAGANCPASGPAVPPVWTSPLNNGNSPVKPGINTLIFATESCMGCHSSAGVWISYDPKTGKGKKSGQLTGDFSWLLSQKAHYLGGAPPVAPLADVPGARRRR